MAPSKKPVSSSKARSSSQPSLKKVKGENFYRNAKAVARLKMLSGGKAVRDRDGKIIQAAAFQKGEDETTPGRVQPDRRWFGNTRVISQTALDHFRTSLASKQHDPYSVLLRRNKLPIALLDDAANPNTRKRSHIVETEPFKDTFGPKAQRKKPRLDVGTFEELSKLGSAAAEEADSAADMVEGSSAFAASTPASNDFQTHADVIEPIYAKGTSRRIYGELYKVIDSSDVILHILDARDPMGTLCESVLEYIKKEKAHKQVVLVINKCDLVPNWVTARYIQHLTPRYPTLAFHASPNHSFGKGSLIQLLRQFSQLHSDKKQISVGFVGYPNVGKSSVINTLKSGKVCNVAPVPGETKVWQYITLTKRIYLIDCPGIVPTSAKDSQTSTVLKGVVRVEALATPSEHIPVLMERVKPVYLSRTYGMPLPDPDDASRGWEPEVFLDKLARMKGRLLKGGEPDLEAVAKIMLSDWVRGRIPFFVAPPERPEEVNKAEAKKAKEAGADAKGKARAADPEEEPRVIGVKQNLGSIMQKNTFVSEDIRPLEDVASGEEVVGEEQEDDAEESDDGNEANEEEALSWNDVFNGEDGLNGEEEFTVFSKLDEEANSVSENEATELVSKQESSKEPRMKTNKVPIRALIHTGWRYDD
ncbi:GTPase required for pre-60S ribosomal subunit nuclear export and maturation, variant 2 [Taiwanofungus camphoratus]|nr:GTPase required for pre-60S ribosomal subunit nuclear export and maturation, variant 2 [Antrodia cinnamomea]KAI0937331.1 GTPase required for pre-60S ribosomal subunit nuclear export and maturation, variant 2 [Antrodia cinnamomea]KAI0962545.1 GTPase required for pre-60S ribosomal subunit nuclear export and maturation, variant 2 [Antrodia cinnamomea]